MKESLVRDGNYEENVFKAKQKRFLKERKKSFQQISISLSSLKHLTRLNWVYRSALIGFMLGCKHH